MCTSQAAMASCFAPNTEDKEGQSQGTSFLNALLCRSAEFFTLSILPSRDKRTKTTAIAAVPQRSKSSTANCLKPAAPAVAWTSDKYGYTKKTTASLFSKTYRIGRTIGVGGFSEVKLGENLLTGEGVAVKIIDRRKYAPKDGASFEREIQVMEKIHHRNCLGLREWFLTKKAVYLVTDLVTGGELLDRVLRRGRFSERDAARAITQILEGVAYLHSVGVVHRDLKLENLLLESEDEIAAIKIADFGLSKIFSGGEGLCTMCGSPQYVAPEVLAAGENKGTFYTAAADLWSVGVILYILLSGFSPFQDKNEVVMFEKIRKGLYSFKSPVWHSISQSAKDMVQQLLCVDPDTRLTAKQALAHPWLQVSMSPSRAVPRTAHEPSSPAPRLGTAGFTSRSAERAGTEICIRVETPDRSNWRQGSRLPSRNGPRSKPGSSKNTVRNSRVLECCDEY